MNPSCEEKLEQNATDVLIYESMAQTCIEKGFVQHGLKCLYRAALLCLKTGQFEKVTQLLRQMYAVDGGSHLAQQLEAEMSARMRKEST